MRLYAPWEKGFKKIATPFENFLHAQTTTGLILIFMTILALILANTPLASTYTHFFHTNINLTIGTWKISNTLSHWINDGLMTIFFFIIGLELKREILIGELSNIKVAILPIIAAIGGMIFPAIIYAYINYGSETINGWGIPMATDIAFAISALVLLGQKIPKSLITFLVALAIVDDLGAVIVIALFYTEHIYITPLLYAGLVFLIMIALNRFGIHMVLPYFIAGIFLWFFMLESGVHATIAGVIAAMTIPSKPKRTPDDFTEDTKILLDEYNNEFGNNTNILNERQKAILLNLQSKLESLESPASKLERNLHLPVALIIIPLFALANAGIKIDLNYIKVSLSQPVTIGIITGLLFGKLLGIFGSALLAIKLKIAKIPKGSSISQIFGIAWLGGIGFTMSIFVADLAFNDNQNAILSAKIGILIASLIAGAIGYIWLRFIAKEDLHCH